MLKESVLLRKYTHSVVDDLQRQRKCHQGLSDYWDRLYEKYRSAFEELKLPNRRVLDIGCGDGRFLDYITRTSTLIAYGLEFADSEKDRLLNLLGEERYVHSRTLQEASYPKNYFGLITLWGVLEHVVEPNEILTKASQILDPLGYILVLVPNIHSRAYQILGTKTPTLNPRAHINFFCENSMSICCRQAGLRILTMCQELPFIDLMHKYSEPTREVINSILKKKESYYHTYIICKES
jgi:SAM-dependent methyltransferase